jgi:ABC-type bacteriocin/lantibiotic exporter with double-glycine peptidase domain
MRVTKQSNPNECGICAINSLVEHFYHKDIKLEIMHNACITPEGLSIFNFECLAQQYGIFIETFQLSWNEFIALRHKEYMVCPIRRSNGLHYVIIKKSKDKITVYDSIEGEHQMSFQEFAKSFSDIIMMVSKNSYTININRLNKVDLLHNLN